MLELANLRFLCKSQYVFQQGDLAGPMFCVLNGSVVVQSDSHTNGIQTILASLYDGALFGEVMVGLASSEEVPRRGASVIAQEDTYLLELDPARYYGILQENVGSVNTDILRNLRKAPCFAQCSDYQLSPLSTHIRVQNNHYGEVIVKVGAHVDGLLLLV